MISGTITTGILALLAALTPFNESSMIKVSFLAGQPAFSHAFSKISGAGLAWVTSSAETISAKRPEILVFSK